ncbi:hypothetical protein JZ751_008164 [Albula glossodonta]|uniref:Uncharacterized protein n=1 Tax=Albula glossodonta TaxID=121402 RepID=A0A8T2N2V3_9TELE|nr:hypothetical protein JZ751_008164 [Albula glossodonta]
MRRLDIWPGGAVSGPDLGGVPSGRYSTDQGHTLNLNAFRPKLPNCKVIGPKSGGLGHCNAGGEDCSTETLCVGLTKKRRLNRNRKYLVAVMQPFPMVPMLRTGEREVGGLLTSNLAAPPSFSIAAIGQETSQTVPLKDDERYPATQTEIYGHLDTVASCNGLKLCDSTGENMVRERGHVLTLENTTTHLHQAHYAKPVLAASKWGIVFSVSVHTQGIHGHGQPQGHPERAAQDCSHRTARRKHPEGTTIKTLRSQGPRYCPEKCLRSEMPVNKCGPSCLKPMGFHPPSYPTNGIPPPSCPSNEIPSFTVERQTGNAEEKERERERERGGHAARGPGRTQAQGRCSKTPAPCGLSGLGYERATAAGMESLQPSPRSRHPNFSLLKVVCDLQRKASVLWGSTESLSRGRVELLLAISTLHFPLQSWGDAKLDMAFTDGEAPLSYAVIRRRNCDRSEMNSAQDQTLNPHHPLA